MGKIINIPVRALTGTNITTLQKNIRLDKTNWSTVTPYINRIAVAELTSNSIVYCSLMANDTDTVDVYKEYKKLSATIEEGYITFTAEIPLNIDVDIILLISNL